MPRTALLLAGWLVTTTPVLADAPPHFLILPGIGGVSSGSRGMEEGFRKAYPGATVEVFDWTTGHSYRFLYHLRAWERNQVVARTVGARVQTIQAGKPGTPIVLVGHSGGGAMVVVALEQLPPDCKVQQAILLAPALSPSYPLSGALKHSTEGIDVFHSHLDRLVLGAGTTCFGTLDRERSVSAGMTGFQVLAGSDEACRDLYRSRLRQHGFDAAMRRAGHSGGHHACTRPDFIRGFVAPVVRK